MAVLRISELPIETFISSSSVIVEPRVEKRVHDWSYLPPGEVEVKDASTATMLFDSSESITACEPHVIRSDQVSYICA